MNNLHEPLVSILIPVYNRESLIAETLESIKAQTYTNWECIVVDDGSTDKTVAIINAIATTETRIQLYKRPNNSLKGACSCRNYAFAKSKGEFVNWFDSDDIMDADFISKKILFLQKHSGYDGVLSKTAFFKNDVENITGHEKRTALSDLLLEDFITKKISWYMPDGMWKRSFLKNKPLFEEALMFGQDRIFHYKLLAHNPKLGLVDKYLTYYRKHDQAISATYFSQKHIEKTHSHLTASIALVDFLKSKKMLTNRIKSHLFKEGIMYLPYCYKNKMTALRWYLSSIFVWDVRTVKNTLKVTIAYLSYKITGKGYAFLKL